MAYENEYHRTNRNPMSYGDVDGPRASSRGILITLAIIGLIIAAIVVFSSLESPSPDKDTTGAIQSERMDGNTAVSPGNESILPGTARQAPSGTGGPASVEGENPTRPIQPVQ